MIADCTMFIVIGLFISSVWYVAHAECFLPLAAGCVCRCGLCGAAEVLGCGFDTSMLL